MNCNRYKNNGGLMKISKLLLMLYASICLSCFSYAQVDTQREIVWYKEYPQGIGKMLLSPDDKYLIATANNQNFYHSYLMLLSPNNGEIIDSLKIEDLKVEQYDFSPDGSLFICGTKKGLSIRNGKTLEEMRTIPGGIMTPVVGSNYKSSSSISRDNKYLACPANNRILVYNLDESRLQIDKTYEVKPTQEGETLKLVLEKAFFSPDSKLLLVEGLIEQTIFNQTNYRPFRKVFETTNFNEVEAKIESGIISPDGTKIVKYDKGQNLLRIWNFPSWEEQTAIKAILSRALYVISPTSKELIVIDSDAGITKFYQFLENKNLAIYQCGSVNEVSFKSTNSSFYVRVGPYIAEFKTPWAKTGVSGEEQEGIKLYPNPSEGIFTIEINIENEGEYKINYFSLDGKIIKQENVNLNMGLNKLIRNLSSFANGKYYLTIEMDNYKSSIGFEIVK